MKCWLKKTKHFKSKWPEEGTFEEEACALVRELGEGREGTKKRKARRIKKKD